MVTDVFKAFSDIERDSFLERYMVHLRHRNGILDFDERRLSKREEFFQEIEANPVCRYGPPIVDQEVFRRNEIRSYPEPNLDDATLWALCLAKVNRTERDGVEYLLSHTDHESLGPENPLTYINIEEFYHTRILEDALNVLGLEMQRLPPPLMSRTIGRLMTLLPKPVSNIVIFTAEVAGVSAFRMLRDKGYELSADQPESMQRIGDFFQQILVDEVGHVHYVRSQLDQPRLNIAKAILPMLSHGFISDIPEFKELFGKERLMDTILAADVNSAVAMYEDKFLP